MSRSNVRLVVTWMVVGLLTPAVALAELLTSGARHLAGPTAPPQGLYLVEVLYGDKSGEQ